MSFQKFSVKTTQRSELLDITSKVQGIIAQSKVEQGICCVYTPHTTAAITINENADPSVIKDINSYLDSLIPWNGPYTHIEGNSAAHIKSSLLGCSQFLIIEEGRLSLGTWQGIFLAEFDGPRNRQVWVKLLDGA